MIQNKHSNGNRTDNLKYNYIGLVDGIEMGEIYNDKMNGFCYSFNHKYDNVKSAMRYSMSILKNASFRKRLNSIK